MVVDCEFFTVRHFNKAFVVYYLMSEVDFKKERFGRDELYKNRSSRKIDSRSLFLKRIGLPESVFR